jgi:hypothetical protein
VTYGAKRYGDDVSDRVHGNVYDRLWCRLFPRIKYPSRTKICICTQGAASSPVEERVEDQIWNWIYEQTWRRS